MFSTEIIVLWFTVSVLSGVAGVFTLYGRHEQHMSYDETALSRLLSLASGFLPGAMVLMWAYVNIKYRNASDQDYR